MPSAIEIAQQQVTFWEEYIDDERERERLTAQPSILLPRLQDGLSRSEDKLKKLEERIDV